MRDCLNHRAGFDRVLMAVAATFLTVSASAALAQDPARSSAAELAIEAAIPRPEPANVPPPSAADIKLDTTATVQDSVKEPTKEAAKAEAAPAPVKVETKPSDVATTPAAEAPKSETAKTEPAKTEPAKTEPANADTATATPVAPAATEPPKEVAKEPSAEPVKAASNVPAADQPVADKLKDMIGAKTLRYVDRKNERAAIEKFYGARDFAPVWSQGGSITAAAKGVIARLKDAASDGLNPADYPVPDFAAATTPDTLADAELKLTASMFDYARQAQSGRMHWSQVSADILYPEHPVDPNEVLAKVTTASDASAALDSYNPPQKLYKELKAKLAQLRGQGEGPVIEIADGPALKYTPARGKKQAEIVEDPRVPQLRAKLGIAENANDTRYDAAVAEAVRKFQNSAELKATGILDDKTVKAFFFQAEDGI